ncbi:MAG: tetratricopeptide repeat protein [Terriglobia bacterium]
MTKSRLEMLEESARTNPHDAFVRYGLAMEYASQGRSDDAVATFRQLIENKSDYTAAYYQAGVLLARLNHVAEARTMFERGIEAATRTVDWHTKGELEMALHELPPQPAGDE